MRKTLVIAIREYQAAVRTKAFLISLLVLPLLMGGSVAAQLLLRGRVDTEPKRFAIIDRTPGQQIYPVLAARVAERNAQENPPFVLEAVAPGTHEDEQRFDLSQRIRGRDLFGFAEIGLATPEAPAPAGSSAEHFVLRYQSNSATHDAFPTWVQGILKELQVQDYTAAHKNVTPGDLQTLIAPVQLNALGLTKRMPDGTLETDSQNRIASILMPLGLLMLMFMMVLLGSTPLIQGVVEEKMLRIAEVLLGSVRPFQLMMGKLLGMVAVSLTLSVIYLGGAYWAAYRYGLTGFLPGHILVWFVVYQALAVLMYGSVFIAIGAACTDMRETQSMLWPVMLLIASPLFIWTIVLEEPNSTFATVASLLPFATPMLMIIRQAVPPGIPWWQPFLGVTLVLAMTTVCVYAAGRIFRVGILMQGKGAQVGEMLKWVVKG
jgi:ABC-2 type transport system permease protein